MFSPHEDSVRAGRSALLPSSLKGGGKLPFSLGWFTRRIFAISEDEVTFARRGFRECDRQARQRLERIGRRFLQGYHAALLDEGIEALESRLYGVESALRGFAYEGAAMGLTILDSLVPPRKKRLQAFLNGPGFAHAYMVHVGAGWALARLHWRFARIFTTLDPLLRWLAIDGYGFHEGYFHPRRYIVNLAVPDRLSGYARRAFDQGLGRSLWFVEGADIGRITATIALFPEPRRADLWSGVALACAYAGGVSSNAVRDLSVAAASYRLHLAQGAAFAAKARQRADNPAPHTEMACEILCGLSADRAARMTDIALSDIAVDGAQPAYEVWRRRIRAGFANL